MPVYQDRALRTYKVEVDENDTLIAASPAMRQMLILENRGDEDCYISFGSTPITDKDCCHKLKDGDRWEIINPGTCEIHGITDDDETDIIVSEG